MNMNFEELMLQDMWGECKCKLKPRDIPRIMISDERGPEKFFDIGLVVGYGRFGQVFEAVDKKNGKKYALKVAKKKEGQRRLDSKVIEREMTILSLCEHPNIIDLIQIIETPKYNYLVLEICTESLSDVLQRRRADPRFTETETCNVISAVSSALVYLHSYEIAHRDLKLQNILCNPDPSNPLNPLGSVKVSDFGLAACRGANGTSRMFLCCCGTPLYMAPEVLARGFYDQKCDIWSLGVVMYFCLVGQPPFPGRKEYDVKKRIHMSKVTLSGDYWDKFSISCKKLLKRMLVVSPSERYSAYQVCKHRWTRGISDSNTSLNQISETKILHQDPLNHNSSFDLKTRCTNPAVYKSLIMDNLPEEDEFINYALSKYSSKISVKSVK